jgi:hypothetical protein
VVAVVAVRFEVFPGSVQVEAAQVESSRVEGCRCLGGSPGGVATDGVRVGCVELRRLDFEFPQ